MINHQHFIILLALVFAFPAHAEEFIVKADSVEAVNKTMERVKLRPEEDQQRFVTVSMIIMQDIIKKQQTKGAMNQAEMDDEIKSIMHDKTLTELEEYITLNITE